MNASQSALRRAALRSRASNTIINSTRQWARYNSNAPQAPRRKGGKFVGFAAIFGAAAAGAYYYPTLKDLFITPDAGEETPKKAQLEFEKPLKPVETKEEYRDLISSQHLQLKHSWEHPGVYAWGSNVGKVIDPDSKDKYIKLPRRIAYFDNQLLRDLKLSQMFGAAVTEKGDLVQWGLGFSQAHPAPVPTLKGKDIVKIDVSLDRIIALSRNGSVYSIPASRDDQEGGLKEEQTKSSWSFWRAVGKEDIHFRNLTPSGLGRGESVVDISSGQEHCLLLTNKGRVFSAASSALEFPSKGQMGVPGLSWENRPKGPYDQPHEIVGLKGFEASQIATGDFHSVVLDKTGKIFTFGCNSFGQLGFDTDYGLVFLDTPTMLPTNRLYPSGGPIPTVTSIAAGGLNTFFSIDAKAPVVHKDLAALAPAKKFPPITSDLWACGQGVYGTLGNGRWSHVSAKPTKVKSLSSLFEFNEKTNMMMPIKIKSLSIGTTHCAAIMDNVTETSINGSANKDDTNWGADALFWGGNEHYQLGTAKRTNMNTPTYIGALDGEPKSDFHRLCVAPRKTVRLGEGGKGRKATLEQKIECGRFVTGVYSAL